nr:ATP-binding cassette domain-containing protein [Neptunicella marina]
MQQIDLDFTQANFVHLIGPNGAGKSTLLETLAGIIKPSSGHVILRQQTLESYNLHQLAAMRSMLKQQDSVSFPLTVEELLLFYCNWQYAIPKQIELALEVEQYRHRHLPELSGGEQQRVQLARVLLQIWSVIEQGEGLLLLDEPLKGLDLRHQQKLMSLLKSLSKSGNKVVMSLHDLNWCDGYADQVVLLKQGRLVATGTVQQTLIPQQLSSAFDCLISVQTSLEGKKLLQTVENPS